MNDSMNKHTQYIDNLFGNDKNLQIQPSYNGFNVDAYLDWEMTMDSIRISETISISRVQLIQELFILKLMARSYMTSNWGVLGLLVKVRR
jgi:hypothetical protein